MKLFDRLAYHRAWIKEVHHRSRRHLGPPRSVGSEGGRARSSDRRATTNHCEQRATIASLREALNTAHEQITLLKKTIIRSEA